MLVLGWLVYIQVYRAGKIQPAGQQEHLNHENSNMILYASIGTDHLYRHFNLVSFIMSIFADCLRLLSLILILTVTVMHAETYG